MDFDCQSYDDKKILVTNLIATIIFSITPFCGNQKNSIAIE